MSAQSHGHRIAARVTLADIAKRCAVGVCTVSRAFSGHPYVREELRERILAAAKEMGYDPSSNQAARKLAMTKHGKTPLNRLIGIFTPTLNTPYYATIISGIHQGLAEAGFGAAVGILEAYDRDVQPYPIPLQHLINSGDLDGIIVIPAYEAMRYMMSHLRSLPGFARRPVVSVVTETQDTSYIGTDVVGGAYELTRHLLALGHRAFFRPSIMTLWNEPEPGDNKLLGHYWALEEYGLSPETCVHTLPYDYIWFDPSFAPRYLPHREGRRPTETHPEHPIVTYIKEHPDITAYIGLNDADAVSAWHALHHAGFRIPEDISIVGFDDTDPMLDDDHRNMLTTVHQPLTELGRQAAQLLLQQLQNGTDREECRILPTKFLIRHSTAPARPRQ